MLLNLVVDNVIRTWLNRTVEDQRVSHDGLGYTLGRCLGFFNATNRIVGSRNSDWLQHAMNILVVLFIRYGLVANIAESRTMTCQPSALRAEMPEESIALKCTGVGDSYRMRLQKRIP